VAVVRRRFLEGWRVGVVDRWCSEPRAWRVRRSLRLRGRSAGEGLATRLGNSRALPGVVRWVCPPGRRQITVPVGGQGVAVDAASAV
jgi:hypothetical protein